MLCKKTRQGRLAARGKSPPAFERRCIPPDCVFVRGVPPRAPRAEGSARRSNMPDILAPRALSDGRILSPSPRAPLGASPDFCHGLLGVDHCNPRDAQAAIAFFPPLRTRFGCGSRSPGLTRPTNPRICLENLSRFAGVRPHAEIGDTSALRAVSTGVILPKSAD